MSHEQWYYQQYPYYQQTSSQQQHPQADLLRDQYNRTPLVQYHPQYALQQTSLTVRAPIYIPPSYYLNGGSGNTGPYGFRPVGYYPSNMPQLLPHHPPTVPLFNQHGYYRTSATPYVNNGLTNLSTHPNYWPRHLQYSLPVAPPSSDESHPPNQSILDFYVQRVTQEELKKKVDTDQQAQEKSAELAKVSEYPSPLSNPKGSQDRHASITSSKDPDDEPETEINKAPEGCSLRGQIHDVEAKEGLQYESVTSDQSTAKTAVLPRPNKGFKQKLQGFKELKLVSKPNIRGLAVSSVEEKKEQESTSNVEPLPPGCTEPPLHIAASSYKRHWNSRWDDCRGNSSKEITGYADFSPHHEDVEPVSKDGKVVGSYVDEKTHNDLPCSELSNSENTAEIELLNEEDKNEEDTTKKRASKEKIKIRLPFLKPLDEPSLSIFNPDDLASILKKPLNLKNLSKEELKSIKLARIEANCQLVYGQESELEEELGTGACPGDDTNHQPLIIGNYITRHIVSRISGPDPSAAPPSPTREEASFRDKRPTKKIRSADTKNEPTLLDDSVSTPELNSSVQSETIVRLTRETESSRQRHPYLFTGSAILALDRWGIWCEARILKVEYKRVLVKYSDEVFHRNEWIRLGVHRIKQLEPGAPLPPPIEQEIIVTVQEEVVPPEQVPPPQSPEPPLPPEDETTQVICSNCGSKTKDTIYFCLHCPRTNEFMLCSGCYLGNFPKHHPHSRLLFAKHRHISPSLVGRPRRDGTTLFEEDKLYIPEDNLPLPSSTGRWGNIHNTIVTKRPGVLGVHRHLPGLYTTYKPTLIMCAFCHDTQHTNYSQNKGILLTGPFVSLDRPFILPPTKQELIKRQAREALTGTTEPNETRRGDSGHIDLFWCHINCARFSNKVTLLPKHLPLNFKDQETTPEYSATHMFYNLARAVRMGNRNHCPKCRERGATIACARTGCFKHYHLRCSGKSLAFFERGQVFFCRSHETNYKKGLPYPDSPTSISCSKCGGLLPAGRGPQPFSPPIDPAIANHQDEDLALNHEVKLEPDLVTSPSEEAVICDPDLAEEPPLPELDQSSISNPESSVSSLLEKPQTFTLESTKSSDIEEQEESKDLVRLDFLSNDGLGVSGDNAEAVLPNKDDLSNIGPAKPAGSPSPLHEVLNNESDGISGATTPITVDGLIHMSCEERLMTGSWHTCVTCLDETGKSPFDLCPTCFDEGKGLSDLNHDHGLECFELTCYSEVIQDTRRGYHTTISSTRGPASSYKRKDGGVRITDPKHKHTKLVQCAYCWATESLVWRKGYSGVLMCSECFEGVPQHPNKEHLGRVLLPNKKKKKCDNSNNGENGIGAPSLDNPVPEGSLPLTLDDKEASNLAHQYSGSIEDYNHLPYYTRVVCNEQNFETDFNQAKLLDSYAPIESHWFSLLVKSSYYDIPGRAPRWASHSGSDYHGTWLPQTVRRALLRYTRPNERVLSNFLGRGTDAIESFLLRRKCVGVDINPVAVSLSQRNCSFAIPAGLGITAAHRPVILQGDSRDLHNLGLFSEGSFDHVLSHPPYKDCVSYSTNIVGDLSKFANQEEFQAEMAKVVRENWRLLKMGGRLTLGIGDNREHCFYIPVSFQLLRNYLDNGFEVEELIIKRQRHCQMFGLGTYLSAHYGFLIFTHEYIFTLKKIPKNRKPPAQFRSYLRPPEEVKQWKKGTKINRKRRAIPTYPIERKSVIMGTVWAFRAQLPHTFEMLCKSRMIERFGKNHSNWEEVVISFNKLADELSDMKPPPDNDYTDAQDDNMSNYEKLREKKIKDNNQKLLSLGLTAELGDERSEDITHHDKMMRLPSNPKGDLSLIMVAHIPNHQLVNSAIPLYRKALVHVALDAGPRLAKEGFLIIGIMDYRLQGALGGGRLVPLSLLVFEDIKRALDDSGNQCGMKLKEMVMCVPDGFQCQRSQQFSSMPVEPSVLDLNPDDPYPNLPLIHATYLIYMKTQSEASSSAAVPDTVHKDTTADVGTTTSS